MTIETKIILDSIAPNGVRLVTSELTYPRNIHSELMTHRVFSRNAASSRAIPTPVKIARIRKDIARPSEWGVNQKGMVASGPLPEVDAKLAQAIWDEACDKALQYAELLCGTRCINCDMLFEHDNPCSKCICKDHAIKLDLHKQVANRIIEPFDHITTVVTSTKFLNHKKLRTERDKKTGRPLPDPTYFELAEKWHAALAASKPTPVKVGEWHLPYVHIDGASGRGISQADLDGVNAFLGSDLRAEDPTLIPILRKVSVGRAARTTYMRSGQGDIKENIELHDRLTVGHWSPFEHPATPIGGFEFVTFQHPLAYLCDDPEGSGKCVWCGQRQASDAKAVLFQADVICMKCAKGHTTSGNFTGWHQYRKEFAGEDGGDE